MITRNPNPNSGIFFIISGIAQIFWVTYAKEMGKNVVLHRIGGTIILVIIWATTRIPGNPITERGGPISDSNRDILDGLCCNTIIILVKETHGQKISPKEKIG